MFDIFPPIKAQGVGIPCHHTNQRYTDKDIIDNKSDEKAANAYLDSPAF
jgi:hypothetical protein